MSKYIIKNCENYDPFLQEPTCNKYSCDCQDCTDCLMKQIVEKCMEDWEDITIDKFQRELLDLLDIREIE